MNKKKKYGYVQIKNFDEYRKNQVLINYQTLILQNINPYYPMVILKNSSNALIANHNPFFIVEIEKNELESVDFWNFIKTFYKFNIIKIAKWWDNFSPDVNTYGFFLSMGWSMNYKTINEWKEWKSFNENSILLLDLYEFPISVIRIWDRFPLDIQKKWLEILSIYNIKRNVLKEIIIDLYDLSYNEQEHISSTCLKMAKDFLQKDQSIFPQDEMKEIIKQKRFPMSYQKKKESYFYKKKLENLIDFKNLKIDIPDDLESDPVVFQIYFRNVEDFEILLSKIKGKNLICQDHLNVEEYFVIPITHILNPEAFL